MKNFNLPYILIFLNKKGELGDYSSIRDKQGYASQFDFTPEQTIELEKAAEIKHSKLK